MIDLPRQPTPRLFRTQQWPKAALVLHQLATYPSAMRWEIAEIVSKQLAITPDSGSLARLFKHLNELGLTVSQDFSVVNRMHLVAIRLTDAGKQYCASLGWPVVENDWERLLRLHCADTQVRHAGACLAFAYQARQRGWIVEMLPQTGLPNFYPDVRVEKDGKSHFVEVELGTRKQGKWLLNLKHQGYVALCARTPTRRAYLLDECAELGVYGMATDLLTLARSQPNTALWSEEWNVEYNFNYIPRPEFVFGRRQHAGL